MTTSIPGRVATGRGARPEEPVGVFRRRLIPTAQGAAVLVAAVVLAALGWSLGGELELWLGSALFAHAVACAFLTWVSVRKLTADVLLPQTAHARTRRSIDLVVRQDGWVPAFQVRGTVELAAVLDVEAGPIPYVSPLGRAAWTAPGEFRARGSFRRVRIRLVSSPLGLFLGTVEVSRPVCVTVFPAVEWLERRHVVPGSPYSSASDQTIELPGTDTEFLGIREYAVGDSPRIVHWPALARTGKLHVKEFARASQADVTVALDLGGRGGPMPREAEEDLVSAAATTALHLHFRDLRSRLLLCGERPVVIPYGVGSFHHASIQNALAHGRSAPESDLLALLRAHHRELSPGSALIVIAMRTSATRPVLEYLESLRQVSIQPMLVLLAPELYDEGATEVRISPNHRPGPQHSTRRGGRPLPIVVPGRPLRLGEVLQQIG